MTNLQYELWDMETANRVAVFDSRQDAIGLVRQILRESGVEAVRSLGLGVLQKDRAGKVDLEPLLDGDELVAEALRPLPTLGERAS
jgi:hypothetical protein